jgi:hypothetical protein
MATPTSLVRPSTRPATEVRRADGGGLMDTSIASVRSYTRPAAEVRTASDERSGRLLRWLIWGPVVGLLFSAFVVTGGLVFFLLPLGGALYAVFAVVAWSPDGREVD